MSEAYQFNGKIWNLCLVWNVPNQAQSDKYWTRTFCFDCFYLKPKKKYLQKLYPLSIYSLIDSKCSSKYISRKRNSSSKMCFLFLRMWQAHANEKKSQKYSKNVSWYAWHNVRTHYSNKACVTFFLCLLDEAGKCECKHDDRQDNRQPCVVWFFCCCFRLIKMQSLVL